MSSTGKVLKNKTTEIPRLMYFEHAQVREKPVTNIQREVVISKLIRECHHKEKEVFYATTFSLALQIFIHLPEVYLDLISVI